MIRCQLIQVTRNRRGKVMREERSVVGDPLRIGRGTDCVLHLPDPRIHLSHATIHRGDDGQLYLEGEGTVLGVQGNYEQRVRLRPGVQVMLGPYEFTVEYASAGVDLVLAVELVMPLPDDRTELRARARTSLAQTMLSKRGLAVGLAVLVAIAFLLLPVLNATRPTVHAASAKLPVPLDASWNPGPISSAHQSFGNDCQACHQTPFVQVTDSACKTCHAGIGDHIANAGMQHAAFGEQRCASCHREHKGSAVMARAQGTSCADCHGDLAGHGLAASTLVPIHDFADDHPPFKLSLLAADGTSLPHRAPVAGEPLVEASGLRFPHDVHLAAGGVASPDGRKTLNCASCHVADTAGVGFQPIAMKTHCADCHRLEFEPAVTSRQVPHGDAAVVMTTLREFYAGIALGEVPVDVVTINGLLRRPTPARNEVERRRALDWATQKSDAIAADLFEVRVCATCHGVSRTGDATVPFAIAPVALTRDWLPKARFDHASHDTVDCARCHGATTSKNSAEVLMPVLATCQACHAGATPTRGKIASDCQACHGFHAGNAGLIPTTSPTGAVSRPLPAPPTNGKPAHP